MASDDVIELGSSDEDTEPAPKKRKPTPNAMVRIPNTLSGVTITPTSSNKSKSSHKLNPASIMTGCLGKNVTVTKVSKTNVRNPYANKKVNGNPMKAQPPGKKFGQLPMSNSVAIPIIHKAGTTIMNSPIIHKTGINPFHKAGIKTFSNNVKANLINTTGVNPMNIVKLIQPNPSLPIKFAETNKKRPKVNNLSLLPPGITIKKANNITLKSKPPGNTIVRMTKPGVFKTNEVLTVDLEDDEPAATPSASGHQWYLRPEDQEKGEKSTQMLIDESSDPLADESPKDKVVIKDQRNLPGESPDKLQKQSSDEPQKESTAAEKTLSPEKLPDTLEPSVLEKQNNKEPNKPTLIEITIEDSPIKPAQNKPSKIKGFKVGADLAITIDDSPVKITNEQTVPSCGSDEEKVVSPKNRNSKKKLEYPKDVEMVEIEIEPVPVQKPDTNIEEETEKSKNVFDCEIVEIEESPIKPPEIVQAITPKKNKLVKPVFKRTETETVFINDKEKEEFHPIYQSFIKLCFQLENSEDMKKIVEKKIKSYYRQVPKEYTESEAFIDMVSSKIIAIKAGPEKMYLYIKDIVDELNLQRKLAKAQPPIKETKNEEQEKFLYGEESEFDSKRQRQIRKLEKTLKKLHRAIQKLEEQEVDFDDEEDSVYLLTDRYKERMVRVHAKLCQLTNTKMPSEARVQIDSRPGRPKGPAKRLEKWINRKVPIGTPLPFPDFHDVLRCVRDANQEDKLGWNEADIMEEARDLFMRCGKKLQRRRQENEWRLAASRIPADVTDPAEDSSELKKKLEENKRVASKKETEVLNKYADRQNQLQLEAVEIGDKEAEESPVESDDEPMDDNVSLISKEKRRERLKRLIQEKSKKVSDEKENRPYDQPVEENTQNENIAVKDSNKSDNTENTEQNDTENKDKDQKERDSKSNLPKNSHRSSDSPEKDIKDAVEDSSCKNKDTNTQQSDKVHSLSDDSSKLESDIDELHLLQKLYSENEMNTSVRDSSDTGTPIAISDTSINDELSGEERSDEKRSSDVISIENSSYSDSEEKKGDSTNDTGILQSVFTVNDCFVKETVDAAMEIEYSNNSVEKKTIEKSNEKCDQTLEDILLASSDEAGEPEPSKDVNEDNCSKDSTDEACKCEATDNAKKQNNTHSAVTEISADNETCINLRDDSISIGETVIEENRKGDNGSGELCKADSSDKNTNTDSSSVEGMEIGPDLSSEERNGEANIVETASIKSTDEGSITEITSVKSTEPNEEGNTADTTSIKSVETIEDGNINESSIKSVETFEDTNINETTSIKSVETIEDGNGNGPTSLKSVESIVDGNINEAISVKSVETIEDETINGNNGDSCQNVHEVEMETTEYTDVGDASNVEKANNDDSIPKPMEVDNVEQT